MIFLPLPHLFDYDLLFLPPTFDQKTINLKKRPICNSEENAEPPEKQSVAKGRFVYAIEEADDCFDVTIDVPGIKLSDIALEIVDKNEVRIQAKRQSSKNTVTKYDQMLVFDHKSVDLTNVHANMESGVLTLKVGKKKQSEPVVLTVSSGPAPTDGNDSTKYDILLTVDLPGVKLDDLKVKAEDNYVHVDAKRQRGQSSVTIRKVLTVDDTKHDVNQLRANLADGVLTITAPHAPKEEVEMKMRSIPITLTNTAEQNTTKAAE